MVRYILAACALLLCSNAYAATVNVGENVNTQEIGWADGPDLTRVSDGILAIKNEAGSSDGGLTVGTIAASGTTTFLTPSLGTSYQPLILDTNDPAAPYFGASIRSLAGVNGATTRDNVYAFGWNVNAAGSRVDGALPAFQWILESDYTSPAPIRQMEHYINFVAADGSDYRPWGVDFYYATEGLVGQCRTDQWIFGKKDNTTDWLKINSNDSAGYNIYFETGTASYIDYRGSAADVFRVDGNEIIGAETDNSAGRLFGGYTTAKLFHSSATASADLALRFGDGRSLGWYGSGSDDQFRCQVNDGTYRPLVLLTQYPYAVSSGTLAATAGAYAELGYITTAATYNHFVEVDVVIPGNCAQRFLIARGSPDVTGSSWFEAIPVRGENEGFVALDVKPNGTSNRMDLRVRRTAAGGSTQAFKITITVKGADVTFTANASTGTGATVAGVYRNSVTMGLSPVSNATATRTLTAADCVGQVCTNTGDADAQVNNLPDAQAGLKVTFSLTAAQDIDVNAATGDQILGLTNATGDAISSDATIGSHITLVAVDATNWVVVASGGTWTDVN